MNEVLSNGIHICDDMNLCHEKKLKTTIVRVNFDPQWLNTEFFRTFQNINVYQKLQKDGNLHYSFNKIKTLSSIDMPN